MDSWAAPPVPELPGTGRPLLLYDTSSRQLSPAAPGGTARMYVCGITPYDATHLGHAATYIAFDLVNRVWRDGGHRVHYVQNVTDVDDPLLARAERDGQDWAVLAGREIARFRRDMAALRVLPPTEFVGVVESVPDIVRLVEALRSLGAAYEVDRDVYFSVASEPRFGEVSGCPVGAMLALSAERGGDPDRPGKKDPLDPILWRAARPGEPSWDCSLGPGRPGWHIECTAIGLDRLGMGFDVQGGGNDLAFPHHEMSAAHGQVVTGDRPFARRYVHAGMIGLHGERMSKSKGNLVLVSRLCADGVEPAEMRLALLAGHYRADRQWTSDLLDEAAGRLARWRRAMTLTSAPDARPLLDAVRRDLADDLDTPRVLSTVDEWAYEALTSGGRDPGAPDLARRTVDALLGVAV